MHSRFAAGNSDEHRSAIRALTLDVSDGTVVPHFINTLTFSGYRRAQHAVPLPICWVQRGPLQIRRVPGGVGGKACRGMLVLQSVGAWGHRPKIFRNKLVFALGGVLDYLLGRGA